MQSYKVAVRLHNETVCEQMLILTCANSRANSKARHIIRNCF